MKSVPEWDVGTYFREPIFITLPKDKWMDPLFYEFMAHADEKESYYRINRRQIY